MFCCLILLLSVFNVYAQPTKELAEFARSSEWLKYLYFQNNESLVIGNRYFLSSVGKTNPLSELQQSIKKLKIKKNYCQFPARTMLINKRWPNLLPTFECSDFSDFKKNIRAGDLYLVFSSVYPNNPASMFGHTFLRLDSLETQKSDSTQKILGYSLGFQAITNPQDNAFAYTFKGLFGGYDALLEVKPFYMDIGIYNNGESRDMWEYKIPLNQFQKEFLVAHIWEVLNNVGFEYYFFKENCSTFSLRFLEVLFPDQSFKTKRGLFVVPQRTLREVVSFLPNKDYAFYMSIKNQLKNRYENLNQKEKKLYLDNKIDDNIKLLDLKVEHLKYKNYVKKTNLTKQEKNEMYAVYLKRAQKPEISKENINFSESELEKKRPDKGHDISRFKINLADRFTSLGLRYGFHDFFDPDIGFDETSYINFLNIEHSHQHSNIFSQIDYADLMSIQNYYSFLPHISWRGKASTYTSKSETLNEVIGGVGLGSIHRDYKIYSLVTFNSLAMGNFHHVYPGLNWGFKKNFKKNYWVMDYFLYQKQNLNSQFKSSYFIAHDQLNIGLTYKQSYFYHQLSLELMTFF